MESGKSSPYIFKEHAFLSGDGEMAHRTRELDWATTSLGPIGDWPQSLRTTVSILLNSAFPMFLWWGNDLTQFYNDAYRPSLGNSGKHPLALGQRGEDCWPEIWPVIKPLIDQVMEQGRSTWMEDQLIPIYRNGQLEDVYWTFSYSPVIGELGSVAGVLVVCTETTEKVVTIRKLQSSDQRFQNLVRDANVGIVILSGEEMVVEVVNEAYGRLIGRTPAELIGKPLFQVIPDVEKPYRAMLDKVRITGESISLYATPYLVYANSKKIEGFLDVIYQPYKEADGTITGVMAICLDVTERALARKKIEEAEEKTRLAIESAEQGTYEINLVTDEMITSDRFNAIWGMDHAFPRSKIVSFIHPDDRTLREEAHRESLATGNLHYEARIVWKDGSVHWARIKGKVIYDESGKPVTLIGVIQDITEQKLFADQLTRQVHERTLELQRSNEDLMQFAHVTSHDLREPLRKMKTFLSRMEEDPGNVFSDRSRTFIERMHVSAARMSDMIEGVLKYSTVNVGGGAIEPIDLNGVLKNILVDLEMLIAQKRATVEYGELPVIEGATILIYQLFYNLIINSLKFSAEGKQAVIRVTSSIIAENDIPSARIGVQDNGIGFDQKQADIIFSTFTRLNAKDKYEGTGLGLSLCKKIVERHHGTIAATGKKNEGATFTILLPLKQPKETI